MKLAVTISGGLKAKSKPLTHEELEKSQFSWLYFRHIKHNVYENSDIAV
jgi:hypothetical protein